VTFSWVVEAVLRGSVHAVGDVGVLAEAVGERPAGEGHDGMVGRGPLRGRYRGGRTSSAVPHRWRRRHNGIVPRSERPTSNRSIAPITFPGTYWDAEGREAITWEIIPATRGSPPGQSGYEIHTRIRGVDFWGYEIDDLRPTSAEAAAAHGLRSGDDLTSAASRI